MTTPLAPEISHALPDAPSAGPEDAPTRDAAGPQPDSTPGPTLVMGLAAGYHAGDVRPFLASLRATGFAGRCVLFASPTTRDTGRMADMGADVLPFERPPALAHLPYNALRYFLYLDLLRQAPRPYARVLITDVRDVIFQRDPFSFPWTEGLNVTLEDARMTIGACPYMTRWTTGHLGEAAWRALAGRRISCSGTTVGGHAAMLDYLERLTGLLLPFSPAPPPPVPDGTPPPPTGMAGYDQGVHNHLLHGGHLPEVTVHDNAGPILTLGYKATPPAADAHGDILNDAGVPAVMVHQYDRMPEVFRAVRARYA
ncbi:hypothetical protein RVX_R03390 [Nitratidesulfovibrio sp. HK-II]|uniref:hypothetical protein n=1 Tax=Nitratidesulfovibrio sp. HK-II TaxID=2009266 RepID=UPI000E2FC280|nr:hypothetical protein RVX_2098 [Nitratidesulfovibrio sp. HK-II]